MLPMRSFRSIQCPRHPIQYRSHTCKFKYMYLSKECGLYSRQSDAVARGLADRETPRCAEDPQTATQTAVLASLLSHQKM